MIIPADCTLETPKVLLRPMEEKDQDSFLQLAQQDPDMWYYFSVNLGDKSQLEKWMVQAFSGKKSVAVKLYKSQMKTHKRLRLLRLKCLLA
jgi:hypothetical protein